MFSYVSPERRIPKDHPLRAPRMRDERGRIRVHDEVSIKNVVSFDPAAL